MSAKLQEQQLPAWGSDTVTGHDFSSCSLAGKLAPVSRLLAACARVKNVGLALPPRAYFAQFAVAMPSVG
ncbi:hypothetical protein [Mesorhizobium sp. M0060]|uniref:hypothetical protein n=1 Tax=Mesorhizobium sp. M0060 TaxID=2956866 RepID=UPI0033378693